MSKRESVHSIPLQEIILKVVSLGVGDILQANKE
jgi:hypothetical protein